jgi:hypothetical protein
LHFQYFVLVLVACLIWLYNCTHMESEKPYAYHELVCSLEICQWCGEPCFGNWWISATNFQVGQAEVITDLLRALWRVNLMLVLNPPL